MNIFEQLKAYGFDTVPESYYKDIDVWKSWYIGDVKRFHAYKVWNGQKHVKCRRYSMGMGKKVCEDWANLLMNEKVSITLEGKKEQDFFDLVCRENNFAVKISEMQELKAALGTVAYVPRVAGVLVDLESGAPVGPAEGILIDYCAAEDIFPLSWENGVIRECAFASRRTVKNEKYLGLQIHRLEAGEYVIENKLYRNQHGQLSEVELSTVPGYENVPATVHTGSGKRQFVIDRLNIANNIDPSLPMGISVYANAVDQLKGVDMAYDSYVNEFVLGKKRIMVQPEATQDLNGEPVFDTDDLSFYVMPGDRSANNSVIKEIDMKLRTAEHSAGIQDMLNTLSSKCGFGENHYRFDKGSIATATQVISENSSMFRTIKKHEIILESVLVELARIILFLGNTYMQTGLREDVEISIDFDDSIIEDKAADFARDRQMLSDGILNDWEFRAKWLNEDEATAKESLPGAEDLNPDNTPTGDVE